MIFFLQTLWLCWTDGESKPKVKKDAGKGKAKRKKQKSKDNEALEDSDDGDYEGLEVDYMSDESRSDPLHGSTQRLTLYQQCLVFFVVCCFIYSFILCFKFSSEEEPEKGKPVKAEEHPKGQINLLLKILNKSEAIKHSKCKWTCTWMFTQSHTHSYKP